jgi:hypothetical protein
METIDMDMPVRLERHNYDCYYRVDRNDTTVTRVSTNDFKQGRHLLTSYGDTVYTLRLEYELCYQCVSLVGAMEKAKAWALVHIEQLIKKGEPGLPELLQYRKDHYEDLHINLVDANIQLVEQEIEADKYFKWVPYRINN